MKRAARSRGIPVFVGESRSDKQVHRKRKNAGAIRLRHPIHAAKLLYVARFQMRLKEVQLLFRFDYKLLEEVRRRLIADVVNRV